MKYLPAIITAAIWFDGVGFGTIAGMAIASHIEGHGNIWRYAPRLAVIFFVLVVFVVLLRIVTRTLNSGRA